MTTPCHDDTSLRPEGIDHGDEPCGFKNRSPLSPAEATKMLRKITKTGFECAYTEEIVEKCRSLDLVIGDVWNICRFGEIIEEGWESTVRNIFKYEVVWLTPNPMGKSVILEAVISPKENAIKACEIRLC